MRKGTCLFSLILILLLFSACGEKFSQEPIPASVTKSYYTANGIIYLASAVTVREFAATVEDAAVVLYKENGQKALADERIATCDYMLYNGEKYPFALLGDVNRDGLVSIEDAELIERMANGSRRIANRIIRAAADVNFSFNVKQSDADRIKDFLQNGEIEFYIPPASDKLLYDSISVYYETDNMTTDCYTPSFYGDNVIQVEHSISYDYHNHSYTKLFLKLKETGEEQVNELLKSAENLPGVYCTERVGYGVLH